MATRESLSLGVVLPPTLPAGQLKPALRHLDESGFGSVWVNDRTLGALPWPEVWTQLGAVIAGTTTIPVGTAAVIPARRDPLHVAHALATADRLSGGRLIAGIGLGGLDSREYALAGVDLRTRGAVTDRYLRLMRRLWSEDTVDDHDGSLRVSGVGLPLRPRRRIPIWIAGGSPAAVRRAAELGDGWLASLLSPDRYGASLSRLLELAVAAGRQPNSITPGMYLFGAVGRTREEAAGVLRPMMDSLFHAPLEHLSHTCIYGTPQDWLDRIGAYAAAGARQVTVLLFSDDVLADLDVLAAELLPELSPPLPAATAAHEVPVPRPSQIKERT